MAGFCNSVSRNGISSAKVDKDGLETTIEYIVEALSSQVEFATMEQDAYDLGLPEPQVSNDGNNLCQSLSANRVEQNSVYWIIEATYKGLGQSTATDIHPTLKAAEVNWSFNVVNKAITKDIDDNGIKNSIGEPFEPAPTIEKYRPVANIKRNVLSFDAGIAMEHVGTINQDTFLGADPEKALMTNISAVKKTEAYRGLNTTFWEVTFSIEFDFDGFKFELLDVGTKYDDNGTEVIPTDDTGRRTNELVFLNEDGTKSTTPKFLEFDVLRKTNFTSLIGAI